MFQSSFPVHSAWFCVRHHVTLIVCLHPCLSIYTVWLILVIILITGVFTKETERKSRTRARSIHISARQNCWRRPRDNVTISTGGEPYQFKHLKAMAWITSIHYMMCPWIEDSKINLGSGAGRSGNIWAEMLKSITALFFYSPKTVMHTKAGMRLSDDPSSSWRGWGRTCLRFEVTQVYVLTEANFVTEVEKSDGHYQWASGAMCFEEKSIRSNSVMEHNSAATGVKNDFLAG